MADESSDAVIVGGGTKALFPIYYKIIAGDLKLDNPWEKLGDGETESLVAEVRGVVERTRAGRRVTGDGE